MTKNEFLEKLRAALGNDLSGPVIQENVKYYKNYMEEEEGQGRSEEEILDELGDPWALAQTIIDSVTSQNYSGDRRGQNGSYEAETASGGNRAGSGSSASRIFLILGIIGIIMVVFVVLGGIVSLAARFIVPIIVLVLISRIFRNKRQ